MTIHVTWKELPGYPALVKGQAAGVVDGYLLAAAGVSHPWRHVEYGFSMNVLASAQPGQAPRHEWMPLPPLPHGICWSSGAACAGGLVVVGGRVSTPESRGVPGKAINEVWFLDFANDAREWERLEDRPSAAVVANTFSAGNYLCTCFGSEWYLRDGSAFEAGNGDPNVYRMNVTERSPWEVVATFPGKPRWFPNVSLCGNKLYVIGGQNKLVVSDDGPDNGAPCEVQDKGSYRLAVEFYNDVWECDLGKQEWVRKEDAPRTFNDRGFSYKARWVICTGGATRVVNDDTHHTRLLTYDRKMGFVSYSNETWAYDTHTGEWQVLDSLPYGIMSHAIAPYGDRVYLVGNETCGEPSVHNTLFEGILTVE